MRPSSSQFHGLRSLRCGATPLAPVSTGGLVALATMPPPPEADPRSSADRGLGRLLALSDMPGPGIGTPAGDRHLDPTGQIAFEQAGCDRQPGPLGGEVCHVAYGDAHRLLPFRNRMVLEVAGQKSVG